MAGTSSQSLPIIEPPDIPEDKWVPKNLVAPVATKFSMRMTVSNGKDELHNNRKKTLKNTQKSRTNIFPNSGMGGRAIRFPLSQTLCL